MSTGDGGMITTTNADWDTKCRLLRHQGMSIPDTVRHGAAHVIFESYPVIGHNYRMTDIQAAIGREQLKRVPGIVEGRRALAGRYVAMFADTPGLALPEEPAWARSNWQSFCVRLPEHCDQREVMQRLLDEGIATRRGIMCSHREPAYGGQRQRFPLPRSERAQDRCIILPLYLQMQAVEQERVARALRRACAR
jgi:dTDP-4-amino-4,6-dideoxygalactose transaminase